MTFFKAYALNTVLNAHHNNDKNRQKVFVTRMIKIKIEMKIIDQIHIYVFMFINLLILIKHFEWRNCLFIFIVVLAFH